MGKQTQVRQRRGGGGNKTKNKKNSKNNTSMSSPREADDAAGSRSGDHPTPPEAANDDDDAAAVVTQQPLTGFLRWKSGVLAAFLLIIGIVLAVLAPWSDVQENEESDSNSNQEFVEETVAEPSLTKFAGYQLLETVPHDAKAFTQGLLTVHRDDTLYFYEGTGMYGASDLRLVDIPTGKVLQSHTLSQTYFGEGIAHFPLNDGGKTDASAASAGLIQLTWKEQTAFEYTISSPSSPSSSSDFVVSPPISNWTYTTPTTQGWGMTYVPDLDVFYVTDGSQYLMTWNATTREEIAKVSVFMTVDRQETTETAVQMTSTASRPIGHLNELEYDPITDTVLANVWGQDVLIRIEPQTGFVTTVYNFKDLFTDRPHGTDVFNGIALTYDLLQGVPETTDDQQVWVTGKYWPNMYRVRLLDAD